METFKLTLKNEIKELQRVSHLLDELESKWELPVKVVMNMNLALEEVVSNVIFYAFTEDTKHEIEIEFKLSDDRLSVYITDDGRAFNPLQTPPPDDLDKKAEERKIGGLGIYFVKNFMDELDYKREGDRNILILIKYIS